MNIYITCTCPKCGKPVNQMPIKIMGGKRSPTEYKEVYQQITVNTECDCGTIVQIDFDVKARLLQEMPDING